MLRFYLILTDREIPLFLSLNLISLSQRMRDYESQKNDTKQAIQLPVDTSIRLEMHKKKKKKSS